MSKTSVRTVVAGALLVTIAGCGGGVQVRAIATLAGQAVSSPESLLTAVLADHVIAGRVDYDALSNDTRFDEYMGFIARISPDSLPSSAHRLALWINAYNAWTLKVICDNYPVESINDLHFGGVIVGHLTRRTVWDRDLCIVGGETMSLDDIEHGIIRRRFDDPRIHFALVCAARSCPPLRGEAYVAAHLDAQLDDQARVFFSQPDKNRFDAATKTAWLSKILDWYEGDFGDGKDDLLRAIAPYAPDDVRASLASNPADWRVKHTAYDWSLNGR